MMENNTSSQSYLKKRPIVRGELVKLEPLKKKRKLDHFSNQAILPNLNYNTPKETNKPGLGVANIGSISKVSSNPHVPPLNLPHTNLVSGGVDKKVAIPPPTAEAKSKHSVEIVREIFTFFLFPCQKWRKWNSKKDDRLKMLMKKFAKHPNKWTVIARTMGYKRGNVEAGIKICKERYEGHLKPGINKGSWTKEEDERIIELQEEYGNDWLKIHQEKMSTRTPSDIEERWVSTLRMIVEEARTQVTFQIGGPDELLKPAVVRNVVINVVSKKGDPPRASYSVNLSFGVKTKKVDPLKLQQQQMKKKEVFRFRRPPPPPPLPPFFLSYRHLQPPLPPGYEIVPQRRYRVLSSSERFHISKKRRTTARRQRAHLPGHLRKRKKKKKKLPPTSKEQQEEKEEEDEYDEYDEDMFDDEDVDPRELREYSRSPTPETPYDETDYEQFKANPRRSTREKKEEKLFILSKPELDEFMKNLSSSPPPTSTNTPILPPPKVEEKEKIVQPPGEIVPPPPPPQQQQQKPFQPPRPLRYCVEKLLFERCIQGCGLMIAEEIFDEIEANSEFGNYKVFHDQEPPIVTKRDFRNFLHEITEENDSLIGECYRGFQGLEYFFKKSVIRIDESIAQVSNIPTTMLGRLDPTGKRVCDEDRRRRRAKSVEVYTKKLKGFRTWARSKKQFRGSDKRNRMRGGREYFDQRQVLMKNANNRDEEEIYFTKSEEILKNPRSHYLEDLIGILGRHKYDVMKSLQFVERNQEEIRKKRQREVEKIEEYRKNNLDGLFSIPHLPPKYDWHITWGKYTHSKKNLKEMIQSSKYLVQE